VKRRDLLRHLERHGCRLLREGANHTIMTSPRGDKVSTVPRHREINPFLARKICRDLDVPEP